MRDFGCCLRPVRRPEARCARFDALARELGMEAEEGVATKGMGPILSK
jgi:hypothetical protein